MISWLAWIPIIFFLVIIQKTVVGVLAFHHLSVDLTMIFVVFAGLNMSMARGSVLTLWAGFLVSVLTGSVTALFMCVYLVIFSLSHLISTRILARTSLFIVCFTMLCAALEGILLMAINRYYLGVTGIEGMLWAILPQIPVLGILSPLFFHAFKKIEAVIHVRKY
ncbi:MAG: hypothetical protein LBV07_03195 [Syntrophobacterales bacterium]|jgi:hypothetical protein|nr:hypothetical protein [Syntrophobacterales bacterium]